MALTPSNMLPLGTKAPNFQLQDVLTGELVDLEKLKSPIATVIMFICNHCPYVKHILANLINLSREYQKRGIVFIAINSNDVIKYPDDSPENMRKLAQKTNLPFPYLFDETQNVAKAYQAACTPDFYIFDKDLLCVYRGQFDSSRPGNATPITGKDLSSALEALLTNTAIDPNQKPSIGCNIKWKENYFG